MKSALRMTIMYDDLVNMQRIAKYHQKKNYAFVGTCNGPIWSAFL